MPDALFQRQTGAVFIHNGRTDAFNLRQLIHGFKTTLLFAEQHNRSAFALPMPFSWVSSAAVAVLRLILASVGSAAPASRLTDNNAAANRCLIHCMVTLLSS